MGNPVINLKRRHCPSPQMCRRNKDMKDHGIKTKIFSSSNFYRVFSPNDNSVTAHIWLVFKAHRSVKEDTRRRIENILRQMLRNHSGSLTTDPDSLRLHGKLMY